MLLVRHAQVQAASAQVAQAAAALHAASAQLDGTLIRTPFSGTIVRIPAEVGQLVTPGTPLVEVSDLTDKWVSVSVESDDLLRFEAALRAGTPLDVTSESYPGRGFAGRVVDIASKADRGALGKEWTVRVKIAVTDPQNSLRPGMEVDVDGQVTLAQSALHLPKEGVLEQGGRAYVFVWNGTTVERTEVTTGVSSLDRVEVVRGIREGDVVVAKGLDHLRSGHRVTVSIARR